MAAIEHAKPSFEEEEGEEAGEEQETNTAKGIRKSNKASEARKEVRKGLIRINADGELEWLATVHSEGG